MGTSFGQLHPSQVELLSFFDYKHLPSFLQDVSQHFHWLAHALVGQAPTHEESVHDQIQLTGPELTVALRKLLEAKDCAVRAALVAQREGGE